jgi:hypothetical protein
MGEPYPAIPYLPYPTLPTLPYSTYPTLPSLPYLPYLPYPSLHYPTYPTYPTLPYPPYPTLPCPTLFTLPHPALPYPTPQKPDKDPETRNPPANPLGGTGLPALHRSMNLKVSQILYTHIYTTPRATSKIIQNPSTPQNTLRCF